MLFEKIKAVKVAYSPSAPVPACFICSQVNVLIPFAFPYHFGFLAGRPSQKKPISNQKAKRTSLIVSEY